MWTVMCVGTKRQGAPWFEALIGEALCLFLPTSLPFKLYYTKILGLSHWVCLFQMNRDGHGLFLFMTTLRQSESSLTNIYITRSSNSPYPRRLSHPQPLPIRRTLPRSPDMSPVLSLAPGVVKLISQVGKLVEGSVKSATDFSYSAPTYAGNGYRIIGDAGG